MAPRLVTIGPSHYCEKARWALDRAGIGYVEEAHAPLVHWLYTVPRTRTRTVPVLLDGATAVTDSTDILRWADARTAPEKRLFPSDEPLGAEVGALEARFDDELGTASRRHAYCYVSQSRALFLELFSGTLPPLERRLVTAGEAALRFALGRAFKVSPRAAARTADKLRAIFGEVSTRLADGRPYLAGERFTAADLTFVSLAQPALVATRRDDELAVLPDAFREVVRELRGTPAGRWALALHARERHVRA